MLNYPRVYLRVVTCHVGGIDIPLTELIRTLVNLPGERYGPVIVYALPTPHNQRLNYSAVTGYFGLISIQTIRSFENYDSNCWLKRSREGFSFSNRRELGTFQIMARSIVEIERLGYLAYRLHDRLNSSIYVNYVLKDISESCVCSFYLTTWYNFLFYRFSLERLWYNSRNFWYVRFSLLYLYIKKKSTIF